MDIVLRVRDEALILSTFILLLIWITQLTGDRASIVVASISCTGRAFAVDSARASTRTEYHDLDIIDMMYEYREV